MAYCQEVSTNYYYYLNDRYIDDILTIFKFPFFSLKGTHELSITSFAGILSKQLMDYGRHLAILQKMSNTTSNATMNSSLSSMKRSRDATIQETVNVDENNLKSNNDDSIEIGVIRAKFYDSSGCDHWVAQYPKTIGKSGKKYTMARKCSSCGKSTCCFCLQCNVPLCYPINNHGSKLTHGRDCFESHIQTVSKRTSFRKTNSL